MLHGLDLMMWKIRRIGIWRNNGCGLLSWHRSLTSPLSSSIVAPALVTFAKDFEITTKVEQQLVLSIMVLAYAIGTLLFGPLSEVYGRAVVLHPSNMMYLLFTVACGFSKTESQLGCISLYRWIWGQCAVFRERSCPELRLMETF